MKNDPNESIHDRLIREKEERWKQYLRHRSSQAAQELLKRRNLNEVVLARRIFALRMQGCPSTVNKDEALEFAKQQANIAFEAAEEFEAQAFSLLEDQYQ